MKHNIKMLRLKTGLSQTQFAQEFGIPVSTYRKWEQGEATPPDYVLALIADRLPAAREDLTCIHGARGDYYYNAAAKLLYDSVGNSIKTHADLSQVHEENLAIYADDLFSDFHEIQARFNRDCENDKKYDIIWSVDNHG